MFITGLVSVLFVSVCVPVKVTLPDWLSTYVLIANAEPKLVFEAFEEISVKIAVPDTPVFITGLVSVLFVSICVAANPTNVSSTAGNVSVFLLSEKLLCAGACICA